MIEVILVILAAIGLITLVKWSVLGLAYLFESLEGYRQYRKYHANN